ncbi:cytochrome b/b6 domain-containing protein [Dechloromonas sp. ARDL1]|uniref:cytochrome b/b6 domain-containing protein n=1 Tax=Dechloromonas sp. ARDL1 TaxID=3322121 RepID=UPI003DA78C04
MNSKRIFLWDLPTRLFHWLLMASVIAAVVTGQMGGNLIEWHGKIGILIAGLLAFRVVWGVVGSTYARFAHFFPTPAKIKAYLSGRWRGEGHNPLGALSVFGLIVLLLVQVVSGLLANDDIAFTGPLADLVSRELSNRLTGVHHLLSNVLIGLVALHIVAIAFYGHVKKHNLIKPMITGWKDDADGESARGGGFLALLVVLAIALAAIYAASGAWLPEVPPSAVGEVPTW